MGANVSAEAVKSDVVVAGADSSGFAELVRDGVALVRFIHGWYGTRDRVMLCWTAMSYILRAFFECATDCSIERLCLHDRSPAKVGCAWGSVRGLSGVE